MGVLVCVSVCVCVCVHVVVCCCCCCCCCCCGLLLLRPCGRAGARPMRASSPGLGANSIVSSPVRPGEMCCLDVQNAPFEHFRKRCAVGVCTLSSRRGRVWGGFGNVQTLP